MVLALLMLFPNGSVLDVLEDEQEFRSNHYPKNFHSKKRIELKKVDELLKRYEEIKLMNTCCKRLADYSS